MATIARKFFRLIGKILLMLLLFCLSARFIDASKFISYETSAQFSDWLYGSSSQENYDDLWFFTEVLLSLIATIISYSIIMKIVREVRR